jgi:hypothetical protein
MSEQALRTASGNYITRTTYVAPEKTSYNTPPSIHRLIRKILQPCLSLRPPLPGTVLRRKAKTAKPKEKKKALSLGLKYAYRKRYGASAGRTTSW